MDEVAITWVQLLVSGDCCLKSLASGAPDSGSLVFLLQNEEKDNSQQLREIIEKSKSGDATKFPPHQTSHRAQLEPPPNGGGCLNLPRATVLTAGKKKSEWGHHTLKEVRWVKLYRQQLLAWFFTRRSSLGEEQSLKFSVEISPGIHPKACGKLQVTLTWMKVWSLAKNVWPPD